MEVIVNDELIIQVELVDDIEGNIYFINNGIKFGNPHYPYDVKLGIQYLINGISRVDCKCIRRSNKWAGNI